MRTLLLAVLSLLLSCGFQGKTGGGICKYICFKYCPQDAAAQCPDGG